MPRLLEDPHGRRPFQRRAVCVEWWPVHRGVERPAVPARVPAPAVTKARDVSHEDLIRAEWMTVGAAARWVGDPLPIRGLQ